MMGLQCLEGVLQVHMLPEFFSYIVQDTVHFDHY